MALKIRYLSDLHLEFINTEHINKFIRQIPPGQDEICILAGDIGNPYEPNYHTFMQFISNKFKKAFVISGNHEYYGRKKTIKQTNEFLQNYFLQYDNISFLNNTFEIYENYCFVGTTLWSHISNPVYKINDVSQIIELDWINYNKLNEECIAFLEDAVWDNTNCIVITHHVPSNSLIDAKYKVGMMLPYNQWFYCDMDKFIEKNKVKIKCWIYGHTHSGSSVFIEGIPFLCNPIGYPQENFNLDFNKTIAI
jgi:predicted MPP superfamily phosphohydrolase